MQWKHKEKRTLKLTYKSKRQKIKFSDETMTSMTYFTQNISSNPVPSKNWALLWEGGANVGEVVVEYKIKALKIPWLLFSHRRIITVVITSWPESSQIKILFLMFKVFSPVSRSIFYLANERLKLLQSKINCETYAIAFQMLLQTSDNRWIILVTWVR